MSAGGGPQSEKRIKTMVISTVIHLEANKVIANAGLPPKGEPPTVNAMGAVMPIRSA